MYDEEERERKSWKEIDSQRDRGFQKPKPKGERGPKPQAHVLKRQENVAKAALEDLFKGKKSKEQEAEWKKVLTGAPKNFSNRASTYVEKFGLPRQWDDLLRLLDHREHPFVSDVLDRFTELLPNEGRASLDVLYGKLRILKMEREESDLLEKIETILTDLSERL